jgi:hypothetical protein
MRPVAVNARLARMRGTHADVAQLVEHHLAKVRVASSNLVIRSKGRPSGRPFSFPLMERGLMVAWA